MDVYFSFPVNALRRIPEVEQFFCSAGISCSADSRAKEGVSQAGNIMLNVLDILVTGMDLPAAKIIMLVPECSIAGRS